MSPMDGNEVSQGSGRIYRCRGAFVVHQQVSMKSRVGKSVMLGSEKIDRCRGLLLFTNRSH